MQSKPYMKNVKCFFFYPNSHTERKMHTPRGNEMWSRLKTNALLTPRGLADRLPRRQIAGQYVDILRGGPYLSEV